MKDKAYYDSLRSELNRIRKELEGSPVEFKCGYSLSVGSVLNAYREGDITFKEATSLLRLADDKEVDREALEAFVHEVKMAADRLI